LIRCGAFGAGAARQDSSNSRIVALSIAPTLNNAEAEEWIASDRSLLNFGLAAIANLLPRALVDQLVHLSFRQNFVTLGDLP
jgi:hypothetical protein